MLINKEVLTMKVQFKLNKSQLLRARAIEMEERGVVYQFLKNKHFYHKSVKLDDSYLENTRFKVFKNETGGIESLQLDDGNKTSEWTWQGNLLGMMENHYFNFNSNQFLGLKGNILTYEGERCPMLQDGALGIIERIFDNKAERIRPIYYKTSIKEMKWFEAADTYLKRLKKEEGILIALYFAIVRLKLNYYATSLLSFICDMTDDERMMLRNLVENEKLLNASFMPCEREYILIDTLKLNDWERERGLILFNDKWHY